MGNIAPNVPPGVVCMASATFGGTPCHLPFAWLALSGSFGAFGTTAPRSSDVTGWDLRRAHALPRLCSTEREERDDEVTPRVCNTIVGPGRDRDNKHSPSVMPCLAAFGRREDSHVKQQARVRPQLLTGLQLQQPRDAPSVSFQMRTARLPCGCSNCSHLQ